MLDVLSVIVPIHNDERRIRSTCLEIAHVVRPLVWDGTIDDYEIVLVDDGSTDGTGQSADVFAKRDRNVRVVHHDRTKGYVAAVGTGLKAARGALIVHGEENVALAVEAIRPAVDKLRSEHLHAVAVHPASKLVAWLVPGRSRAAMKLIHADRAAEGERDLPRKAIKFRLEPSAQLVPRRGRVGAAAFAGIGLVTAIVALGLVSANTNTNRPQRETSTLVGRHGHIGVAQDAPPRVSSHGTLPATVSAPARAVVIPATPAPVTGAPLAAISPAIDNTCASDVSVPLQERINSAPNDSTISLDQGGCYLVGRGLTISKRSDLTIDGHGAKLRNGAVTCSLSRGIAVKNLTVAADAAVSAVDIRDCSSVAISNVKLSGSDAGLTISGTSIDISVDGLAAQTDHDAVKVMGGRRIALAHLDVGSAKAAAVGIYPPKGATVEKIEVRASVLTSSVADIASFGEGTLSSVFVHNNDMRGGRTKIYVRSDEQNMSRIWRVYANHGDEAESLHSYVDFSYAKDILIANNAFPAKIVPLRAAVFFTGATGNLGVVNNDFTGACRAYGADTRTGPVRSSGNKVSNC